MHKFIPAGELVRAVEDLLIGDGGSIAIHKGTAGMVEGRDGLVPDIYWVTFMGSKEPIAVREHEIELIPSMDRA